MFAAELGPTVILLHGFPEDWYAYHKVMPHLAKKFEVVAVDLPGIGGSSPAPDGYDAASMAEDVHLPWKQITAEPYVWHINFQQVPDLPEHLVADRQTIYFRYFLDPPVFSDADVARYAKSYAAPEHLHAGFEIYRAFLATAKFNAEQSGRLGKHGAQQRREPEDVEGAG